MERKGAEESKARDRGMQLGGEEGEGWKRVQVIGG